MKLNRKRLERFDIAFAAIALLPQSPLKDAEFLRLFADLRSVALPLGFKVTEQQTDAGTTTCRFQYDSNSGDAKIKLTIKVGREQLFESSFQFFKVK